jgi:D-alanyl-D-alanine carboxypeptidase
MLAIFFETTLADGIPRGMGASKTDSMTSLRIKAAWAVFACAFAFACIMAGPAEAAKRKTKPYNPPSAELVMDYHTGEILYARNADAERHPASLTKVMTLYMVFEELKAGKITLDTRIRMSSRAASQAPSKLGLRAGEKIRVEDAIMALVTKSANDVACAVAEHLGGTEKNFSARMTQRARDLGMTRSRFENASGLPNKAQITTARDMAILAKRIQTDFPGYYHYFSAREFSWKGNRFKTHNHLLGKYTGTTGLKTGYTAASGFNLTATVQRDGKSIIGVVLGGNSVRARDKQMMAILDRTMPRALALRDTGTRLASNAAVPAPTVLPAPAVMASAPAPVISSQDRLALAALAESEDRDPDEETYTATPTATPAPVQMAALSPTTVMPAAKPVAAAKTAAAPAPTVLPQAPVRVAAASAPAKPALAPAAGVLPTPGNSMQGSATERATAYAVSALKQAEGPMRQAGRDIGNLIITPAHASEGNQATASLRGGVIDPVRTPQPQNVWALGDPLIPEGTWVIQIGAYADQGDAVNSIRHAIKVAPEALTKAVPVTIPVKTAENKMLYRSRFGGFIGEKEARNACGRLARESISCVAIPPANWTLPKSAAARSQKQG